MGREFEVKLRVPSEAVLQEILQDSAVAALAIGAPRELAMESVYYDTADGILAQRRWTLRRRRENARYVVTVKTPAPGRSRGEWETEAEDVGAAIDQLVALGAPEALCELRGAKLLPVCGAVFTRTALNLRLPDGTLAELAADRGVLSRGKARQHFVELELELKSGKEGPVEDFCQELARRYGLTEETRSKFARASHLEMER